MAWNIKPCRYSVGIAANFKLSVGLLSYWGTFFWKKKIKKYAKPIDLNKFNRVDLIILDNIWIISIGHHNGCHNGSRKAKRSRFCCGSPKRSHCGFVSRSILLMSPLNSSESPNSKDRGVSSECTLMSSWSTFWILKFELLGHASNFLTFWHFFYAALILFGYFSDSILILFWYWGVRFDEWPS